MKFCDLQRKSCVRVYAPGQTFAGSKQIIHPRVDAEEFLNIRKFFMPANVHAQLRVLRNKGEVLSLTTEIVC